jgi:hypothetical protein
MADLIPARIRADPEPGRNAPIIGQGDVPHQSGVGECGVCQVAERADDER